MLMEHGMAVLGGHARDGSGPGGRGTTRLSWIGLEQTGAARNAGACSGVAVMVWRGKEDPGTAGHGSARLLWVGQDGHGMASDGAAVVALDRLGLERSGTARRGLAASGGHLRGLVWLSWVGRAWPEAVRQGAAVMAGTRLARTGKAWSGAQGIGADVARDLGQVEKLPHHFAGAFS